MYENIYILNIDIILNLNMLLLKVFHTAALFSY